MYWLAWVANWLMCLSASPPLWPNWLNGNTVLPEATSVSAASVLALSP
jgi:hypothetical protein